MTESSAKLAFDENYGLTQVDIVSYNGFCCPCVVIREGVLGGVVGRCNRRI